MSSPTQITVGSNTYSLVELPEAPAPRNISITLQDTVAVSTSPFTAQVQTQTFPGADWLDASIQLPTLSIEQIGYWTAFLASCRGQRNVFQLGDSSRKQPMGNPQGVPVVDGSNAGNNAPMSTVLSTKGWTPGTYRNLLPGDYMQIGYRLYMCMDVVNADANGNAEINIFPSIREVPADETAIQLANTKGLFRLSENTRKWSADAAQLFGMSFNAKEAR